MYRNLANFLIMAIENLKKHFDFLALLVFDFSFWLYIARKKKKKKKARTPNWRIKCTKEINVPETCLPTRVLKNQSQVLCGYQKSHPAAPSGYHDGYFCPMIHTPGSQKIKRPETFGQTIAGSFIKITGSLPSEIILIFVLFPRTAGY
jgi:hypothetical protein